MVYSASPIAWSSCEYLSPCIDRPAHFRLKRGSRGTGDLLGRRGHTERIVIENAKGAVEIRIVTLRLLCETVARVLNAALSSRELTMATRYVSEIMEEEFPAWRRALYAFPDSYAAWRWYFSHDRAVAGSAGDEVVSITVHPAEFLAHCKADKIDVAMASFREFAQRKSAKQ